MTITVYTEPSELVAVVSTILDKARDKNTTLYEEVKENLQKSFEKAINHQI